MDALSVIFTHYISQQNTDGSDRVHKGPENTGEKKKENVSYHFLIWLIEMLTQEHQSFHTSQQQKQS